ncbi:MAG: prepilin-type N-terminal cleavage/methylation domain-containing protein [Azoarcus sp.]|nr:prepilin-type N-terminal cleavage/methylation domain-containing protein [Azoarcus sp.]
MSRHTGFTLIELLVICSILAALAYAGLSAYAGVDRHVEDELARVELLRLASALGRFHDDTGYWPGEGPFQPAGGTDVDNCSGSGAVFSGSLPAGASGGWFASPANFSLLFERPELCTNHPLGFLENWNPATHRGWNGPYLPLANRHWLDVRENIETGTGDVLLNVPAFGIGPAFAPVCSGNECALRWRSLSGEASTNYARHARPFLFLPNPPRVVYWGPDGRYGGTNNTDPLTDADACQPNVADKDGADDVVICL